MSKASFIWPKGGENGALEINMKNNPRSRQDQTLKDQER